MPSKYSHSVVLASYSSRGLISLPNDQQNDYIKRVQSPTASNAPLIPPGDLSTPAASPDKGQFAAITSLPGQLISSHEHARNHQSNHSPRKTSRKHDHHQDYSLGVSNTPVSEPRPQQAPQSALRAESSAIPRLKSPYNPNNDARDPFLQADSPEPANKTQQNASISNPLRRSVVYASQTVLQPPSKAFPAGIRPPPVTIADSPRRSKNIAPAEALLSIQQFLDDSPRIERPKRPSDRHISSAPSRGPVKVVVATPNIHSKPLKTTGLARRSPTSFIESSDEDDHDDNSPRPSARNATSALPSRSQLYARSEDTPESPTEKHHSGNTRLDLTKDLPAIPDLSPQSSRDESKSSRPVSADFDDSFDLLPLQRHSPPRLSSKSKDKRRSLGPYYPPLWELDSEASSSRHTSSSPNFPTRKTTRSGSEPDLSHFAVEAVNAVDAEDLDDEPNTDIHIHRRYYRSVHKEVPKHGVRPRITTSKSQDSRRTARTPTPIPRQSPSWDLNLPDDQSDDEPDVDRREFNILTDSDPGHSRDITNPMPNFGIPSIVRSPQKGTRPQPAQAHQQAQAQARPSVSTPKAPRTRSLRKQQQPRSHLPALTRIAEARSQDETPSTSMGDLPKIEETDHEVFGADILMRFSSELEDQETYNNQKERRSEAEEQLPKVQDDFATDLSVIPADQIDAVAPIKHSAGSDTSGSVITTDTQTRQPSTPVVQTGQSKQDNTVTLELGQMEDEDEEFQCASPPPDITRYRRTISDETDGLQSLLSALRAGPTPGHSNRQIPGLPKERQDHRLEELIRQAEAEERKRALGWKKGGSVLGRFLKR